MKKGDFDAASKIPKGTLGTSTGVSKNADNELSLIDFSGDDPTPTATSTEGSSSNGKAAPKQESLEDDLLGLSMQDTTYGQGGGIALGFGANMSKMPEDLAQGAANGHGKDVPGPSLLSSSTQQNTAKSPTPSTTPQLQQTQVPTKPNYDPFAILTSSHSSSRTSTPAPTSLQQQSSRSPNPPNDPFAALSSNPPPQPSPSLNSQRPQQASSTTSASLFGFASPANQPSPRNPPANIPQQTNGASADDEWNFSSALPDEHVNLPASNDVTVHSGPVNIIFKASRPSNSDSVIHITASFSNRTTNLVTEYEFKVAVTKVQHHHPFPTVPSFINLFFLFSSSTAKH